ncbi:MAG: non-hydrolyzing UDP-N-acetylglucosamine 2-epimerase [Bacteroidota bacterium]
MHITLIAGARPNFMKISPIINAIKLACEGGASIDFQLVHTGQHFDEKMSATFFRELNIPEPNVNLECGGGTQAEQTAAIMVAFEKYMTGKKTDLVLVVGDVTSTMACTIVAKKLHIRTAHVEAGIRSGDMTMPEEINRIVTDSICDYYFTTTEQARTNLLKCGVPDSAIYFVGNTMIDTLLTQMPRFRMPEVMHSHALKPNSYYVLTLHRPSNVDSPDTLNDLLTTLHENSLGLPIVFPVHPRTAAVFNPYRTHYPRIITCDPLGYLEFNYLVKHAKGVITDSGGITEETTVMGIPCITLRNSTERPETCTIGTNELVGNDKHKLIEALNKLAGNRWKEGRIPEKWDGKAATRIVNHLLDIAKGG